MKELEMMCYEFSKLMIADVMTKKYLRSYLASALLIAAFEILADKIIKEETLGKFDNLHIKVLFDELQNALSKYFGFNKFVLF